MTRRVASCAISVVSSSVMPSTKYSWFGSFDRFSSGRTAMDLIFPVVEEGISAMFGDECRFLRRLVDLENNNERKTAIRTRIARPDQRNPRPLGENVSVAAGDRAGSGGTSTGPKSGIATANASLPSVTACTEAMKR